MRDVLFVNVAGFFYSGSSAVVDLIKEFRHVYESKAEIRFIKDPYGISEMEGKLVNNWELINSSAAISDFIEMCRKGARYGKGLFSPMGHSYEKNISPDFMQIIQEYVGDLVDFEYNADYYHYKFKKSYPKYVLDRYRWAAEYFTKGRIKLANRKTEICYFAHPTQEQFNKATQKLFEKLFKKQIDENDNNIIVLDQAISPNNTQVIHRYFKNSKMIIVDRDPRDMFVDEIRWGVNLDKYETRDAAIRFAKKTKELRKSVILDSDVKLIKFEDLIINYEQTLEDIVSFLGISREDHIYKQKYLIPSRSIKNIGIWRKYYSECGDAIDTITEMLPEMLYDTDKLYM